MEWSKDRVEAIIGVLASERKEIKIKDKQALKDHLSITNFSKWMRFTTRNKTL